jgi:Zn-dependent peptidase ImmA (M78 family)
MEDKKYMSIATDFDFDININDCDIYQKYLQRIYEAFDINVQYNSEVNILDENEEARTIWGKDRITVIFDDTLPHNRKYVALAHELGHIILDHDKRYRHGHGFKFIAEHEAELLGYALLRIITKTGGF